MSVRGLLIAAGLGVLSLGAAPALSQQSAPLTPSAVRGVLAKNPKGAEAQALAERIRSAVGLENLRKGITPRLEETQALFAIETEAGRPRVTDDTNLRDWPLTQLEGTQVWVGVAPIPNFRVVRYRYQVGMESLNSGALRVEYFPAHPDSLERPGVPKGTVREMPEWKSRVFAGTTRKWWVYVPAQYSPDKPAAVMVFQDGQGYLRDASKTATVFDNLIARGDMPVTVGIFLNPGVFEGGRSNRSVEYDTLSDRYARFLRDEILPEVGKTVRLTDDPERRAICGISSGGICAFTVAWEMPDLFRKVLSQVGSFTNIQAGANLREGGHNYPALIRKGPLKPLRVFLQDGSNDLDNDNGNWPLANQQMAAALRFRGYDHQFVFGEGFHSKAHGAAIFPDSLRWLWRDAR